MGSTQTIEYDALARQYGALSSSPAAAPPAQPTQIDYDALARQHGAISSTPAQPAVTHFRPNIPADEEQHAGVYHPDFSDRIARALPIIDRIKQAVPALQRLMEPSSTWSSIATPSNLEVMQKPRPGMSDERAVAPEQLMTPEERQHHPILTGVGEVAGGLTTPGNMLLTATSGGLGKVPGVAGKVLPRVASGVFSALQLRDIYREVPECKAAIDRGDVSEAERIFTHITLGAAMAALGIKHAASGESLPTTEGPVSGPLARGVVEGYRALGQQFSKLKSKSLNMDHISEAGTGLYNSIRQDLITHQEALRNDGGKTIRDAINADKAAPMNSNRGAIPTASVVGEASKVLDATQYDMKPAERAVFRDLANRPELTLEQAKTLRTQIGRIAFGRSSLAPEARAVFTTASDELGEGMKDRIQDLQGTAKPYEHYNDQFKASFELNKGIAGEMLDNLQGQDRHAAMPKLEKFTQANLKELQEQMRKIGLTEQASRLDKSKQQAASLSGAYDAANGKYMQGIYRLAMQNPAQAVPGLFTMMAMHGLKLPFPLPQLGGTWAPSKYIARKAGAAAYQTSAELHETLPEEYFRTRTQVHEPTTYTYANPDEGWTQPSPTGGSNPEASKAMQIKQAKQGRGNGGTVQSTPTLPSTPTQAKTDRDEEAKQLVHDFGKGSTAMLQRKMRIGQGDATRYIDRMQAEGYSKDRRAHIRW